MSTRAMVCVTDGSEKLFFYRHSDGYPDGTLPSLREFVGYVKNGKIRNSLEQAAGWLVWVGMKEYKTVAPGQGKYECSGWKIGAYEPCSHGGEHGDTEYTYTVNISTLTVAVVSKYGDDSEIVQV